MEYFRSSIGGITQFDEGARDTEKYNPGKHAGKRKHLLLQN